MSSDLITVAVWAQDPLSMPERATMCLRFRSNEMSVALYPISQLEVPMV
jgi:hypothetical protein